MRPSAPLSSPAAAVVAALVCCLFLASLAPTLADSRADGIYSAWGGAAYRRLLQGLPTLDGDLTSSEAAEIQAAAEAAGGDAGQYTDWVTACEAGRRRCANQRLASWGYQCETLDHSACCLQPNGRFCVPVALFANETTPETWVGRDNTTAPVDSPSPSPKPEGDETADGEDGSQEDGSADTQENAEPEQQDEDSERDESSQAEDTPARKDRKAERGSDKKGEDKGSRGGKWRSATATFFNSYPACCTSDSADQTECDDYNGCQWAGMFAGASGKKSKGWVSDHDIVAVFEAGNNKNWASRWKGKTLRLKNTRTGHTLDALVLDTCSDSDCKGCCTRNARKHGGLLIDLEWHTAQRFWGGSVPSITEIEWQEV